MSELYHHGIKGQRWGIRRTAEQLGHFIKSRREKNKAKKEVSRPKSVFELSDEELNSKIKRMQSEKLYLELYRNLHPEKKSKGKEFVSKMLAEQGGKVAKVVVDAGVEKLRKQLIPPEVSKTLGDFKKMDIDIMSEKDLLKYAQLTEARNKIEGKKKKNKDD